MVEGASAPFFFSNGGNSMPVPQGMAPLKILAKCVADFDTIKSHAEYCSTLGLKYFVPSMESHNLEAVLVGSAPSVTTQVGNLKKKRRNPKYVFFGIKGGHDFLVKNKIQPDYGVAVDPLPKIVKENFLLDAQKCVYFIASQCHPSLFDGLMERDKNVVIWHLLTTQLLEWSKQEDCPIHQHYMIPGGSTSGLRAICLAFGMGFRKFHLYGYDSCLQGKLRKVTGETCENTEKKPDEVIDLHAGDKDFRADKAMASQAQEFQALLDNIGKSDPIKVKAYGRGLIQTLCSERYRLGGTDVFL
jgi:uncharacterized Rossmann fold enzyme